MTTKKALITGITGQDGSYLAELLLGKGYEVHGIVRRVSTFNRQRIDGLRESELGGRLHLHYGDLGDSSSLNRIVRAVLPDEVYNLGAQSHVAISFETPEYTTDVTAVGTVRLLDAMRDVGVNARFYQASSSEMFGKVAETPQRETTPFHPRSPYGAAKVYAHNITVNYRESYGLFACSGILFNHESPRRGENFVTRKITRAVGRIANGSDEVLALGNLDARRDWGFAGDYVEAMWMMLQAPEPDDYVIATGETHTVREFCERSFACAGMPIRWEGQGQDECGRSAITDRVLVRIDQRFFRPAEVDLLLGDSSKAQRTLGWQPTVRFESIVEMMTRADLAG
ncbi:MAG: GDP-mannose 4,6-dehydratase [Thermoanaerobaculia bacterium]